MTNAVHSSSAPDGTPLGDPAGFVLEAPDLPTIYFTGDSAVHADMALIGEIYEPAVTSSRSATITRWARARRPTRRAS